MAVKVDDKTLSVTGENALALHLKPEGGLEAVDATGMHIKTGTGLKTDTKGLSVTLAPTGGSKQTTTSWRWPWTARRRAWPLAVRGPES
ncbi:hypothetical protein CEQ31_000870 [Serratia odorifera]|nr:hypothetical protein CEQ31_000870 [Serratia odorifera]